ncbi:helix-turn-helix domain-containing protein [uncultured Bacteroides sp.]|uniref:helix-turn-helix domain-containing protein n=1 Tax=uncultured Bacteroides sp. TaxID=162156 RepID=UPI0025FD52D0|nr:helix-turn-helix domain-containing protein [uncultured Bacteroides sp.]
MKMDFPQVDLPTEVLAWTNVTEDILNIYKQSCRLQACIVAICTEGSMKASINLLDYEIRPNDLITLLPGTIIQFREKTEKVCLSFAGFSARCTGRINLIKSIGNAYPKLIEQPVMPLTEEVAGYLKDYFALLTRTSCNENFEMDSELVELALQTILTSIRLIYRNYPEKNNNSNRKKEICRELIQAITENYKHERRAQFYADKLGVSLQHLSTTVRQVTGKSVLDTIAYIVIMDAKAKLKATNMTIQEIAYSLNFPSASFFGKYFRRYVGMTPLEFRNRKA